MARHVRLHPGRVLLIDNELHPETLARRLDTAANALGLDGDWRGKIDVLPLRGRAIDLHGLVATVQAIPTGKYALILADAFYRFLPPGIDENSNSEMTLLYNVIDGYADHLGAAWVNIHHSSKGDQSGKQVTDVGAGAGAQSRAADTHLILRPHEKDDVVVLEAAVRSFPPVEPLAIRWSYPLWQRDDAADPKRLKRPKNAQEEKRSANDATDRAKIVAALAGGAETTVYKVRKMLNCRKDRAEKLLWQLVNSEEILETIVDEVETYRLSDPL